MVGWVGGWQGGCGKGVVVEVVGWACWSRTSRAEQVSATCYCACGGGAEELGTGERCRAAQTSGGGEHTRLCGSGALCTGRCAHREPQTARAETVAARTGLHCPGPALAPLWPCPGSACPTGLQCIEALVKLGVHLFRALRKPCRWVVILEEDLPRRRANSQRPKPTAWQAGAAAHGAVRRGPRV